MDHRTPATPDSVTPVYDDHGHGIAVIEIRPDQIHSVAAYVIADDRLTRHMRARYVPEHRAMTAQLHDYPAEAEHWAHRRTAVLTD
jgi:hypothetical protein